MKYFERTCDFKESVTPVGWSFPYFPSLSRRVILEAGPKDLAEVPESSMWRELKSQKCGDEGWGAVSVADTRMGFSYLSLVFLAAQSCLFETLNGRGDACSVRPN